jgi:hypothetical protein
LAKKTKLLPKTKNQIAKPQTKKDRQNYGGQNIAKNIKIKLGG